MTCSPRSPSKPCKNHTENFLCQYLSSKERSIYRNTFTHTFNWNCCSRLLENQSWPILIILFRPLWELIDVMHQLSSFLNWCEYISKYIDKHERYFSKYHFLFRLKSTIQQSPSSSIIYPSSHLSFYDSGYSSPSFHFSSCPYSNDSYYLLPSHSCKLLI